MSKTLNIFTAFENNGSKALDIIRKNAFNPEQQKVLRNWGITDACRMIGRSVQTLRDLEKEGKIPPSKLDNTGKRTYSLGAINNLRDYFGTRPSKPTPQDTAILAVANFKGGVSKTTTAINAAHYFALKGYKVLFIDGDSQGSGTQCFGYIPDSDIQDEETLLQYFIGNITSLHSVIRKTYWDNLDLIPANLALYNVEFVLPVKTEQEKSNGRNFNFYDILRTGIDTIKDSYDIIIIDCPPSMGMISINAIYAANALLIPVPPSMLDFSSTIQFFGMLKDVMGRLPEKEYAFIRLLTTKFERSENSQTLLNIIKQLYADYVMISMMPNSEAIKKASTDMLSIYEVENYAGSKKTLDRIRQAADEVNNELEDLITKFWHLSSKSTENLSNIAGVAENV